jgi:hypothetical protein
MLCVDCDAPLRPLIAMSGEQITACPLSFRRRAESVATAKNSHYSRKLKGISQQLLAFIDSLPEQVTI